MSVRCSSQRAALPATMPPVPRYGEGSAIHLIDDGSRKLEIRFTTLCNANRACVTGKQKTKLSNEVIILKTIVISPSAVEFRKAGLGRPKISSRSRKMLRMEWSIDHRKFGGFKTHTKDSTSKIYQRRGKLLIEDLYNF